MELIVTSKGKLVNKYANEFSQIQGMITKLQAALKADKLDSSVVYVDDEKSLKPFGLKPVNPDKPDKIKELIDAIHKKLTSQKKVLEHILIVGGDEIIPFHHVKNPTDDQDTEVLTDNPYASKDADILIPERSLGRIPDCKTPNVSFLINLLNTAIIYHGKKSTATKSVCFSAEVWTEASKAVCNVITGGKNFHQSLPVTFTNLNQSWIKGKQYQYFNLHGAEDQPNWYGQTENAYPIAFNPENLDNVSVEGSVVFCEACYGANIIDKNENDAISLKYLNNKALCFVGSTKIAYGPEKPPSTEADLIGVKFLGNVKNYKMSFGESLMKAKQHLAKEMIGKQGHLDEDDQKTLLEFVLYGDPSLKLR